MKPWEKFQAQQEPSAQGKPWERFGGNEQPEMSVGEAAFINATNPLGFGDEIKAGIAAGVAKLFGGAATQNIDIGDLYREARTSERAKLEKARQDRPLVSLAGQLASDVGIAGKMLKGAGLAEQGFTPAVKGGAMLGATGALGETEDLSNAPQTLKDVAIGATVGGAVGGAAQKIFEGGSAVASGISGLVKRMAKPRTAEDILESTITSKDAGKSLAKLKQAKNEERISILPDVAGEEVSGLTRLLAKTPGSKNIINLALSNRTAQSSKRVADLINKNVSSEAYFGNLDDIIKARAETSAPLYKKAYEEGNNLLSTPGDRKGSLQELIDDSRIKDALSKARKDYGISDNVPDVSIEALHGARQQVDDIIGSAYRAGEGNKARSYMELKNKINRVLYEASPTLKEADRTFAGFSALKNAQELGIGFNKFGSAEEIKRAVMNMTPGEKDAFRVGVREYLMRNVDKTADASSSARKIFANELNRSKLKVVFDNQSQYNDFGKRMIDEIRIFDTKQRILGGSRTDINLADEAQIIGKVASGVISPKTAGINNLIGAVADSLKKRYIGLNDKTAKELAQILTSKEKSITALERIVSKNNKEQEQKEIIKKAIAEIVPIMTGKAAASSLITNEGMQNENSIVDQ